ncbi:small ubiquitin-related modifier 2-like [Dama dama]|uniref:small ubiquitin-related modifier 2-like n=1 Tax=Dama dama TaxID=30532 RepID=UPI002A36314B|nr:small ubiquitin-related modifier 2-like [Dama dama]
MDVENKICLLAPSPSSTAAASFFCRPWCRLCARSVPTWYLFCEAAAEETPALAIADEKPKEGVKTENNDHITLKVAGQDGSVVQSKIKRHTPLSKLMKAYCERQGLSMRQIRFRFDGQPINETDTPAQLEMEDEDTIDVFQQQTGGVY